MSNKKPRWETKYQCSGCGEWYYSEGEAESCCDMLFGEVLVCPMCDEHIDYCECGEVQDEQ